jgi:hypothetical protein
MILTADVFSAEMARALKRCGGAAALFMSPNAQELLRVCALQAGSKMGLASRALAASAIAKADDACSMGFGGMGLPSLAHPAVSWEPADCLKRQHCYCKQCKAEGDYVVHGGDCDCLGCAKAPVSETVAEMCRRYLSFTGGVTYLSA